MRLIRHDEHLRVELDEIERIVRVTRTPTPYATIDSVKRSFGETARAFPGADRSRWRLLVDMRAAKGRNDPEFERAVGTLRAAMFDGFERTAMLVATAVGKLQVQRVGKQQGGSGPSVFTDEREALEYLRHGRD